jgi:hypothetical protein
VSLTRPWWLGALALLLPLLILHLRRPALTIREVPSLLVWERLSGAAPADTRRLRRPRHPLLLALEALVLSALVLALAGPHVDRTARPTTVFVLDDSFWMQSGTRLGDARADLLRIAAGRAGRVALVSSSATPRVLYRGSRSGLGAALADLRAGDANGDLAAAITLAAGELGGSRGHVVVLRAPEDALPGISASPGQLVARVVGAASDDQGIFAPKARCGIGPDDDCEVLATLRNGSSSTRVDSYTASAAGQRSVTFHATVPPRSTTVIALTARPGSTLRLRLHGRDAIALDDTALVTVPGTDGAPDPATVTLVGDPGEARPLAQAFASVPGVTLRLRTPRSYRASDARASELVVLDGFLPPSGPPAAPAVLLIDPPRLPGGAVGPTIARPTISSSAAGSALLQGVDLTSLAVARGQARSLVLPPFMSPVISTPDGPLLAAGDDGRQRIAVLAFAPQHSNLAQLAALPILARNLVGWADAWVSLADDGSLLIDAVPGATQARVTEASGARRSLPLADGAAGVTGLPAGRTRIALDGRSGGRRRALVSALLAPRTSADVQAAPIPLAAWAAAGSARDRRSLAPWLVGIALLAMAAEWGVWWRIR